MKKIISVLLLLTSVSALANDSIVLKMTDSTGFGVDTYTIQAKDGEEGWKNFLILAYVLPRDACYTGTAKSVKAMLDKAAKSAINVKNYSSSVSEGNLAVDLTVYNKTTRKKQSNQLVIRQCSSAQTVAQQQGSENPDIYGWDIKCVGADDLTVLARQSDDDFYVDYKSKSIAPVSAWMDSSGQFYSELKTLLFVTDKDLSKGIQAALAVNRTDTSNNTFASGVINIEGFLHSLNCFVRFGEDEEKFDEMIDQPFPTISTPVEVHRY